RTPVSQRMSRFASADGSRRVNHGSCRARRQPQTTSSPASSTASRRGMSAGSFWRSASRVTMTGWREWARPAARAAVWPKLRRRPLGRAMSEDSEDTMTKKIAIESTAEAYLELLAARGVEYLFANAGTDFAPLIEAWAKRLAQGQALPKPVTVPHETPAVAMAHGYAMVTGRPQAVMVHVIVGAANALAG